MFQRQTPLTDLEPPLLAATTSTKTAVETAVPMGNQNKNLKKTNKKNYVNTNDNNMDQVIDTKCTVVQKSFIYGIIVGLILQCLSLWINEHVKTAAHFTTMHNVVVAFTAYVCSKYWMPIALLLPAAVVAMRSRSLPGHLRLEALFDSLRFQFGVFFGSILLASLVNFYDLAAKAPLPLLLAYYAVCLAVSFAALCLIQFFVNEVCSNVRSIEVIINYDDNDDNQDDDEENNGKDENEEI